MDPEKLKKSKVNKNFYEAKNQIDSIEAGDEWPKNKIKGKQQKNLCTTVEQKRVFI